MITMPINKIRTTMYCLIALALVLVPNQKIFGMGIEGLQESLTTLHAKLGDLNQSLNAVISTEEPGGEGGLAAALKAGARNLKKAEKKPEKDKKDIFEELREEQARRKEAQKKTTPAGEEQTPPEEKKIPKKAAFLTEIEEKAKARAAKDFAAWEAKMAEERKRSSKEKVLTFGELWQMMEEGNAKTVLASFVATSDDIIKCVGMQIIGRNIVKERLEEMDALTNKLREGSWLSDPKDPEKFQKTIRSLSVIVDLATFTGKELIELNNYIRHQLDATKKALSSAAFKQHISDKFSNEREKKVAQVAAIVGLLGDKSKEFEKAQVIEKILAMTVTELLRLIKDINTSDTVDNRTKLWGAQKQYRDAVGVYIEVFAQDQQRLLWLVQDIISWVVIAEAAEIEWKGTVSRFLPRGPVQRYKEARAPEYLALMYGLFKEVIKKMDTTTLGELQKNVDSMVDKTSDFVRGLAGKYILRGNAKAQVEPLDAAKAAAKEKLGKTLAEKKEPAVA